MLCSIMGRYFLTFLMYLLWQLKEPSDSPFNELSLMSTVAYSDLIIFTSPRRILQSVLKLLSRIFLQS